MQEIHDQLEHERRLMGGSRFKDLMREMWTIPGNRNRALISVGLMICQQMTGTNAINYYAPQIFTNLGLSSSTSSLFATGIYGVMKMTMCFCFLVFAADSLGRRKSLLWTSIAMGLAMMYVGLYVRIKPPVEGQKIPPAGYFALVCIYLFASFFQWGWGPVCNSNIYFTDSELIFGPGVLDIRLRNSDCSSTRLECGFGRGEYVYRWVKGCQCLRHLLTLFPIAFSSMAIQSSDRAVRPKHVSHNGRRRVWMLHPLFLLLLVNVRVHLVPGP
jgi:hypothetical protein